jgi:protein-S-isoprenylcysteine O-methyltransferase Ste14
LNAGAITFITISAVWVGSEIALARRKRSQLMDKRFEKSSPRMLWLIIPPSVTVGVFLGVRGIGNFGGGSRVFAIAGLILILSGLVLRWVAILTLKQQFTVDVAITTDHSLVREGIYCFIRHPAYAPRSGG